MVDILWEDLYLSGINTKYIDSDGYRYTPGELMILDESQENAKIYSYQACREPICMYTYISNPIGQPTTAAHFNLPKTCIFVINPKQVIFDKNQPHRPASIKMLFSKKILKIFYNFISNY